MKAGDWVYTTDIRRVPGYINGPFNGVYAQITHEGIYWVLVDYQGSQQLVRIDSCTKEFGFINKVFYESHIGRYVHSAMSAWCGKKIVIRDSTGSPLTHVTEDHRYNQYWAGIGLISSITSIARSWQEYNFENGKLMIAC
jgi:hypothetical protein